MAAYGKCHVRSMSFPSRTHPNTAAIEQELNKLITLLDPSSASNSRGASIHASLSGLVHLQECTHDLLATTTATRQLLSLNHSRKHMDELLDHSLRMLDACNAMKDLLSLTRQHVRSLISASRRRSSAPFSDYVSFRRSVKREASRLAASLKKTEHRIASQADEDGDHHLWAVREVNAMNCLVLGSLLSYLWASKTKGSKWRVVSRLMKKRRGEWSGSVDDVVCQYMVKTDAERKQAATTSLEALEISLEGFESSLECVFRRLVRTRASLLNIFSH